MHMGRGPRSGWTSDTVPTTRMEPTPPWSRALANQLARAGVLRSEAWRRAVERVPRDLFLPRFYEGDCERGVGYRLVDGSNPDQRERWIAAVYDPGESLVTGYDPRSLRPTGSATMPRTVVAMLEALDVEPGQRTGDRDGERIQRRAALRAPRFGEGHHRGDPGDDGGACAAAPAPGGVHPDAGRR
jgi:hypothetical protein